jgi:hypothetical protein
MSSLVDAAAAELAAVGLRAQRGWLADAVQRIQPPPRSATDAAQSALLAALKLDIRRVAVASLPPDVAGKHKYRIPGPVIVQVDEIVNVGASADPRGDLGNSRLLKYALTDGAQQVYAIELVPLRDLSTSTPLGCKLIIRDVEIRRGLLILAQANVQVLGGSVEGLVNLQLAVYGAGAGAGAPPPQGGLAAAAVAAAAGSPQQSPGLERLSVGSVVSPIVAEGSTNAILSPSPASGGRRSLAPPLASPELTNAVALPAEAADYEVEEILDEEQEQAEGIGADVMDIEDMGAGAGAGGAEPIGVRGLLAALAAGPAASAVTYTVADARACEVQNLVFDPSYGLQAFLCSSADGQRAEAAGEGLILSVVAEILGEGGGAWIAVCPSLMQTLLSDTACAQLAAELDKTRSTKAQRRVAREKVAALELGITEHRGRVRVRLHGRSATLVELLPS